MQEDSNKYSRHLIRQNQKREKQIIKLQVMLDQTEASGANKRKVSDIMKDMEKRLYKNSKLLSFQR